MSLKIYQYPKCGTCRKAIQFLKGNNIPYQTVDITENPPTRIELRKMLTFLGGDLRKLFNTSGVHYRELKMKDTLPKMTEKEAIDLLSKNGRLVKRPFALAPSAGLVGFNEEIWRNHFG
ncbi:MAG: arsenate reductase family protein [bacterium]|nr:arsenate reductase family protein [bacterium]